MILNLIHSTFGYCYPHYACRKEIMNCFMLKQPFYNSMNQSAETIKTTGLAGGMHHAFKAMVPAARHGL